MCCLLPILSFLIPLNILSDIALLAAVYRSGLLAKVDAVQKNGFPVLFRPPDGAQMV